MDVEIVRGPGKAFPDFLQPLHGHARFPPAGVVGRDGHARPGAVQPVSLIGLVIARGLKGIVQVPDEVGDLLIRFILGQHILMYQLLGVDL